MIQYKPSELVDLSQAYQKKCRAKYNEVRNVNEKKKLYLFMLVILTIGLCKVIKKILYNSCRRGLLNRVKRV